MHIEFCQPWAALSEQGKRGDGRPWKRRIKEVVPVEREPVGREVEHFQGWPGCSHCGDVVPGDDDLHGCYRTQGEVRRFQISDGVEWGKHCVEIEPTSNAFSHWVKDRCNM